MYFHIVITLSVPLGSVGVLDRSYEDSFMVKGLDAHVHTRFAQDLSLNNGWREESSLCLLMYVSVLFLLSAIPR